MPDLTSFESHKNKNRNAGRSMANRPRFDSNRELIEPSPVISSGKIMPIRGHASNLPTF
jgi:hypothetical protein